MFSPNKIETSFLTGMELASVTILVTILLEVYSMETAVAVCKKDKKFYFLAVTVNFINHYCYGIPVYICASLLFVRDVDESYNAYFVIFQILAILFLHSLCYYEAHKTFHSCPGYYKYHKFHHRFNTHVPPMSANAVGFVEYLFAYILPFAVAAAIVRPYATSFRWTIYIVSMTNLSIHTPKIEAWSERHIPSFWVSTHDHLEHHRKLNVHYAAPTMNIDWVIKKFTSMRTTTNSVPSAEGVPAAHL